MPQFLDGLHNQRSSMGYRLCTEALQFIPDDIPLLYDKWDGTINPNTLFRGNVLYASFVRGRQGAKGLFEGNSKLLQAKCHEQIQKITHTTPGGSILTIWLYWADTQVVKATRQPLIMVIDTASDAKELDDIFGQARSAVERTTPPVTSPPQDNHEDDWQSRTSSPSPPPHSRHFSASHPAPSPDHQLNHQTHRAPPLGRRPFLPCLGCEAPTCTTDGSKRAILIPTECSPEPLSKQ
ncbi:hypothetical protein B0H13DRAFT_2313885 [Mycena leptocephala]|nr:hypothetical protein B0H13DRAFT_2313885 [Mycena leptocephala]